MSDEIKQLLIETLRDPRAAAPKVLSMPLTAQVWWLILATVVTLNSVIYGLFLTAEGPTGVLPWVASDPLGYAVSGGIMYVGLVITFDWIGRLMGGQGTLLRSLVAVTWLQCVQLIVLTVLSVLGLVLGGFASLLSLGFSLYFLWMTAVFLNEAHLFQSLGKSALLLFLGFFANVIALSLLLALTGFFPVGPV